MSEFSRPTAKTADGVSGQEPIIVVDHVEMTFNIANEQLNSLKEYFLALAKGNLVFKEFKALEDISFTVNKGDVYGIVGTNGSGKSTLLKIISGVLEPTKGTCDVYGSIAPLIELGAGFDLELTARENVYLNGALLGYSKKFINEHFDEIVEFAEVKDFIDMPLKNYSSGMVARIAFAIATATIPDILVVDEALSVGDFMFQEKCERRINDLVKHHGTTLLFVSHSIDQVERVCKQALWIEQGHKRMSGSVSDVCFAYRNMEYTNFVEDNGIMELKRSSADALRQPISMGEMAIALWKSVGRPAACTTPHSESETAWQWADSLGILARIGTSNPDRIATREDLAVLIRDFSHWRKPSMDGFERIDEANYCDKLPEDDKTRNAVEWCIHHKLISGIKRTDGSLALALNEPATKVTFAKTLTRLYTKVYSYPPDVKITDWYVLPGYYDFVTENGIITGYDDGRYGPKDCVTRGQAVTIFWRCSGQPEPESDAGFPDVKPTDFFSKPVNWACETKLASANTEDLFEPNQNITYEELAVFAFRFVHLTPEGYGTPASSNANALSDEEEKTAFLWCADNGLFEASDAETKDITPSQPATRAAMTKLIAVIGRDILASPGTSVRTR